MSKSKIRIEFLAGTDVKEVIEEAKELAVRLQVAYVSFNFNGIEFSVGPTADVEKLYAQYPTEKYICGA